LLVQSKRLKYDSRTLATAARTQPERQAVSDAAMAAAAVALICERGAAATTLKDVGVLAGYSRGLAGYRFGTKAGLWAFLVHTIGEEWLAELSRAAAGTTGLQTLHAALDAHCAILIESPDRFRAFYTLWFDSVGPDPALRDQIARIHERRRRDVERWISNGIQAGTVRSDADVRGVAEQFVSQIVGIVYAWLVADPDTPDHARVAEQHSHLKRQMTEALAPDQE
jgi:AcrR family transcriptional regulator